MDSKNHFITFANPTPLHTPRVGLGGRGLGWAGLGVHCLLLQQPQALSRNTPHLFLFSSFSFSFFSTMPKVTTERSPRNFLFLFAYVCVRALHNLVCSVLVFKLFLSYYYYIVYIPFLSVCVRKRLRENPTGHLWNSLLMLLLFAK